MAVILHVNYIPTDAQNAIPFADRQASAERINQLDGFRWKFWVSNADANERGGVYLFDDEASARAWGENARARLTAAGGREVSIRVFNIDPELSRINQAPIAD